MNALEGLYDLPDDEPRRILLLALLPIGDTLFSAPTIRALGERYPRARITALVHAATASIVQRLAAVDDVVVLPLGVDWVGPRLLVETLARLRACRYDVAIDFTSPAYKWISAVCGIPARTYMKFDPLWWMLPAAHRRWRSTHASQHYYDCARELDLPPWGEISHGSGLSLAEAERGDARRFLQRHGVAARHAPLIAIHAGGAWLGGVKQWPPERFAALAESLEQRWGARIILLGGGEERALARRIALGLRKAPIIAAGAVPLLTSMALIEACDLFIGDDSGLLHAAALLGTRYVGIFGPTWPANFQPIPLRPGQGQLALPALPCRTPQYFVGGGLPWRRPCCQGTCRALQTIAPQTVLAHCEALLRQRFAPAATTLDEWRVSHTPQADEVPAR